MRQQHRSRGEGGLATAGKQLPAWRNRPPSSLRVGGAQELGARAACLPLVPNLEAGRGRGACTCTCTLPCPVLFTVHSVNFVLYYPVQRSGCGGLQTAAVGCLINRPHDEQSRPGGTCQSQGMPQEWNRQGRWRAEDGRARKAHVLVHNTCTCTYTYRMEGHDCRYRPPRALNFAGAWQSGADEACR